MPRGFALLIALLLVLMGMVGFSLKIQEVKTSGTVYIRANGAVEGTDKISSADNVTYAFTDNIYDEIVVERDNIIVDGAGYTLQGAGRGNGCGILLGERSNVTIKNMEIKAFGTGINLYHSSNNTVSRDNITDSSCGISVGEWDSYNNTLSENNVTNSWYGIILSSSSNILRNNIMTNNTYNFDGSGLNDVDTSNTVDGKPIYYWINETDKSVPNDAGYVALLN